MSETQALILGAHSWLHFQATVKARSLLLGCCCGIRAEASVHPLSIPSPLIDNLAKLQPSMHLAASSLNGGRCSGTSSLHGRTRSTRTLRRPILRYAELVSLHILWTSLLSRLICLSCPEGIAWRLGHLPWVRTPSTVRRMFRQSGGSLAEVLYLLALADNISRL
jgi:hypothetical protein